MLPDAWSWRLGLRRLSAAARRLVSIRRARRRVHCLVLHPETRDIAVVAGWRRRVRLPSVPCAEWGIHAEDLRQRLRDAYGLDAVVLRPVGDDERPGGPDAYVMDLLAEDAAQQFGVRWLSLEQFLRGRFDPPEARTWIASARAVCSDGDANAAPWTRPGWYARTVEEIAATVHATAGDHILGITQAKTSPRSCLLRCETTRGKHYVKAVPAPGRRELTATVALSRLFPEHLPNVIAVNTAHDWMLLRESPGPTLIELHDLDAWSRALVTYGRLQRDSTRYRPALIADGWEERAIERWGDPADRDLDLVVNMFASLSGEEPPPVEAIRRRLAGEAEALSDFDLPLTIHHGDLNPANIVVGSERDVFLDWDGPCLGHPFCSVAVMIEYFKHFRGALREQAPLLVDAYLSVWCDDQSLDEVRRAWDLARPFAILEYATPLARASEARRQESRVTGEMRLFLIEGLRRVLMAAPAKSRGALHVVSSPQRDPRAVSTRLLDDLLANAEATPESLTSAYSAVMAIRDRTSRMSGRDADELQDIRDAASRHLTRLWASAAADPERMRLLWNHVYGSVGANVSAAPTALVKRAIEGRRPGTALDVGMGQGRNAVFLAQCGWRVTGFDQSDEAVRAARAHARQVGVEIDAVVSTDETFPYGRDRWDLIVMTYVRQPPPHIAAALSRALRPGGRFVWENACSSSHGFRDALKAFTPIVWEESLSTPEWTSDHEMPMLRIIVELPAVASAVKAATS